jgi:hypothetical protein
MKSIALPLLLIACEFTLPLPAQAAGSLTRTFVSSTGVDSNPCTVAQPCATFAAAYAAAAANGIVAALDPGKYGGLTINSGITIDGNGWSAITAPANSSGIIIEAGAGDTVSLRGLRIDGFGGAATHGISAGGSLSSGATATLEIINCVVTGFSSDGISVTPGVGTNSVLRVSVINTNASNNAGAGFKFDPSGANGAVVLSMDQVTANGNATGLDLAGNTLATIAHSEASNDTSNGLSAQSGAGAYVSYSTLVNLSVGTVPNDVYIGSNSAVFLSHNTVANIDFAGGAGYSDGTNWPANIQSGGSLNSTIYPPH